MNFLTKAIVRASFAGICLLVAATASASQTVTNSIVENLYFERINLKDGSSYALSYQTGTILLWNGIATLTVPPNFKYLPPKDAKFVMEDLFGNDPADTLWILVPREYLLAAESEPARNYFIDITWNPTGYVSDEDAASMNFDEILSTLQEQTRQNNEDPSTRIKGELVGWAESPHYDSIRKILYFAKNIHFFSETGNTLNYQMQFLGRKWYVQFNLVSDIGMLNSVKKDFPTLLESLAFSSWNQYSDFDASTDEKAEFGLVGLLGVVGAAAVAKKVGLLVVLAKFWKILAIAIIAFFAKIRQKIGRFFKRGGDAVSTNQTEPQPPESDSRIE